MPSNMVWPAMKRKPIKRFPNGLFVCLFFLGWISQMFECVFVCFCFLIYLLSCCFVVVKTYLFNSGESLHAVCQALATDKVLNAVIGRILEHSGRFGMRLFCPEAILVLRIEKPGLQKSVCSVCMQRNLSPSLIYPNSLISPYPGSLIYLYPDSMISTYPGSLIYPYILLA